MAPVNEATDEILNVSIYGRPKTGKTRLLATFPKPVVILGPEDGTKSIRNVPGVMFVRVISDKAQPPKNGRYLRIPELQPFFDELREEGIGSLGLDTASALNGVILSNILDIERLPEQKSWGMATRDQYGQASLQLRTIMRAVLDMPFHSVIVAHEKVFKGDDDGVTAGSDLIQPQVGSELSDKVCNWLNGAVDYVCQTFIRQKEETTSTMVTVPGQKPKEVKTTSKVQGVEHCLRVGPHPVFMTGFRIPPGGVLPEVIVDPSFDKIYALATGRK
jgi:hypothetical protein